MSSKPVKTVGSNPPVAAPPSPAWPKRSYMWRLSVSASTEYASAASLNFSSAALSPGLRSGWYLSASLRYALLISWSVAVLRDAEDLVVVALAAALTTFRDLHHRRTQQTVAEHVAALQFLHHFAFAMLVARLVNDGLVDVRVEVGAERFDGLHAALAQQVEHLLVDQLDALA